MNEASSSLEGSTIDQNAQTENATILVSFVNNAKSIATTHRAGAAIIEEIRNDTKLRERITGIREKYWRVMAETNNDRAKAKEAIDGPKRSLRAVLWSGTFSRRSQEALLQYSGLLCADLDGMGESISEVRSKLTVSAHLWALFMSPTGDGLKAVFRVSIDAEKHKASFRAVEEHVRELTDLQIDQACKDVSRLCFLSHDEDAYFNESAIELPPLEREDSKKVAPLPLSERRLKMRKEIAKKLLGDFDWQNDGSGYCTCPGKELHTGGDGDRDCQVYLDCVPTVHCFHESCLDIVAEKSRELRSRIGKAESSDNSKSLVLPEIVSADGFLSQPLPIPPELVEGLIHQGTLTMFAGGSKAAKSFTALDLAISISQGLPFWERSVEKGRVLYVNFELANSFLQQRLRVVGEAKGLILEDDQPLALPCLDLWNLRGYAADADVIMPCITQRCRGEAYSMIILDPMYKLTGGRNENAAGEMCEVLNHFDKLAHETGAAVVYSHHFAKGLAANKEQLDRASGSGVFARHADAIITITPHEEEGAVVVEATLRNLRAPSPFVLRWSYPLMRIARDLDPKKLKAAPGRKSKYCIADLLDCLVDGMTTGDWQTATTKKTGMVGSTFAQWKSKAIAEGRVEEKNDKWYQRRITVAFDPTCKEAA